MRYLYISLVAAWLSPLNTLPAQAKSEPLEVGMDAAVTHHWSGVVSTYGNFPLPLIRLGIPLSANATIEPSLGYTSAHTEQSSSTSVLASISLVWRLHRFEDRADLFVHPAASIAAASNRIRGVGYEDRASQVGAQLGVGGRWRLSTAVYARSEVNVSHGWPTHSVESHNAVSILLGLSVLIE